MFSLYLSFIPVLLLSTFIFYSFSVRFSRKSSLLSYVSSLIRSSFSSNVGSLVLYTLFVVFIMANLLGNIPLNSIPTLFYSVTLTCSLLVWIPIIICVSFTQLNEFFAHLLPYGSPVGLILFLPLVEIFSQIIRPLTLMIRLSTNLSAGHIIMYMFSYFTLLSSVLSPFIHVVLSILFVLELCISILQAYIFVSLVSLYINETA